MFGREEYVVPTQEHGNWALTHAMLNISSSHSDTDKRNNKCYHKNQCHPKGLKGLQHTHKHTNKQTNTTKLRALFFFRTLPSDFFLFSFIINFPAAIPHIRKLSRGRFVVADHVPDAISTVQIALLPTNQMAISSSLETHTYRQTTAQSAPRGALDGLFRAMIQRTRHSLLPSTSPSRPFPILPPPPPSPALPPATSRSSTTCTPHSSSLDRRFPWDSRES